MKGVIKMVLLAIGIACVLSSLYGCAIRRLRPEFAPMRTLPPEAVKMVQPSEIEVMTGVPPAGKEYIELGYITVDESKVSDIMTMFTTEKDIIEMVRREAAEHGADAVIKFHISGEERGERKAKGIAIVYKKYGY